jgi:dihydrofolate reductase
MTQLNLIVACAQNRVIGLNGAMPWHIHAELQHFKRLTTACPVIMGRKTWDSILQSLGKPLPGRHSIVVTRNPAWQAAGATVAHDLPQAIAACGVAPLAWVIGGAQLYAQALPFVTECHITEIQANFDGDAWFAALDAAQWHETGRAHHIAQAPSGLAFDTVVYRRSDKVYSASIKL